MHWGRINSYLIPLQNKPKLAQSRPKVCRGGRSGAKEGLGMHWGRIKLFSDTIQKQTKTSPSEAQSVPRGTGVELRRGWACIGVE